MGKPETLTDLITPAAVVDMGRMTANLDRMAEYAGAHGLALRPHIKTHKTPQLAREQLRRGAAGLTVATVREAEIMAAVADDLLLAYPPLGRPKLDRLMALPREVRLTVSLDSEEALAGLSAAATAAARIVGVLVEVDTGMRRIGLGSPAAVVALARRAARLPGIEFRGIMTYPGHIRQPVTEQGAALEQLTTDLGAVRHALEAADLPPAIVSAGSTPAAFNSHRVPGLTEIRPGTYIFNDRTTVSIGACAWADCAYTVLATVVSTAVAGQAVVDAGSKALTQETPRGLLATGFGALLDRPEIAVKALSEEHGILDLSVTDWRPGVGDRVRIVPNHVCASVNMHTRLWGVREASITDAWTIAARGWTSD